MATEGTKGAKQANAFFGSVLMCLLCLLRPSTQASLAFSLSVKSV
jgi:hypothetical protein